MAEARRLARPRLRADALRNYEALVAAAREVFSELGPDAPLDVIARRAGVGNATLYRHFPSRRDLHVAVSAEEVEALCGLADRLAGDERPRAALVEWLRAYIDHITTNNGLAKAFDPSRRDDSAVIAAAHEAVETAGGVLLAAAQEAGEMRADVRIDDLLALVNAVATASVPGQHERTDRLLHFILEGTGRR